MNYDDLHALLEIATNALSHRRYDEAERSSEQMLMDLAQTDDAAANIEELSTLRADAKRILGTVSYRRGRYREALELFTEALHASQEIHDQSGMSEALSGIGVMYRHLSDYPLAIQYHNRALNIDEQLQNRAGVAKHLGNLGIVYTNLSDYSKALEYLGRALSIVQEIGTKAAEARNLGNIGTAYNGLSDYTKALEYYQRALGVAEEIPDKAAVASWLGGIGLVYCNLSDYAQALEYYGRALSIDEELGNKAGIGKHLGNIGTVHAHLSNFPKALEYFTRSLNIYEELGDKEGISAWLGNIGAVYLDLKDFTNALEYSTKALNVNEEADNSAGIAMNLANIGSVYQGLGEYSKALEFYHRSLSLFEQLGERNKASEIKGFIGHLLSHEDNTERDEAKAEEYLLESIAQSHELGTSKFAAHKALAELYKKQQRWQEYAEQLEQYHAIKDELGGEKVKKIGAVFEQRRQIAEREKEIAIAKAAAEAHVNATTTLLHKVLPPTIARRMVDGEDEIADYFISVSILFADIVGFTPLSAEMPAIVVVRFLNYVFGEFDRIIKKYGCEKIKTIGDGYMAVCGAPIPCEDHAERIAAAALEMQETISLPSSIREFMPEGIELGVRIGLHIGPVVAGVIGEERFIYDVYSDAVNTAARMESHGVQDKVHCSNDFFRHMQNRFAMTKNTAHGIVFEKRGEMEIKGKGMMRTYFLEKA